MRFFRKNNIENFKTNDSDLSRKELKNKINMLEEQKEELETKITTVSQEADVLKTVYETSKEKLELEKINNPELWDIYNKGSLDYIASEIVDEESSLFQIIQEEFNPVTDDTDSNLKKEGENIFSTLVRNEQIALQDSVDKNNQLEDLNDELVNVNNLLKKHNQLLEVSNPDEVVVEEEEPEGDSFLPKLLLFLLICVAISMLLKNKK